MMGLLSTPCLVVNLHSSAVCDYCGSVVNQFENQEVHLPISLLPYSYPHRHAAALEMQVPSAIVCTQGIYVFVCVVTSKIDLSTLR